MIQNQSAFRVCHTHETVKRHGEEKRNKHDFKE